jgi:hypothetical protein
LGVNFGLAGADGDGGVVSVDCAAEAGGTDGAAGAGVEGGVAGAWFCPHKDRGSAHRHSNSPPDCKITFTFVLTGEKAGSLV